MERLPKLLPGKELLDPLVPEDTQVRHVHTLMHKI
jgi:hypothetical protein